MKRLLLALLAMAFTASHAGSTEQLRIWPVSSYQCLKFFTQSEVEENGPYQLEYKDMARLHFFEPTFYTPPSVPPTLMGKFVCHEYEWNGYGDYPGYRRLGLRDRAFDLWDMNDPSFVTDSENKTEMPINKEFMKLLSPFIPQNEIPHFAKFMVPQLDIENQERFKQVGVLLNAWVDDARQAFCPGYKEYNSTDLKFRLLGKKVGQPTQGLFMGFSLPELLNEKNSDIKLKPSDRMYLSETELLENGFYFDSGSPTKATKSDWSNRTIYFYYPFVEGPNPLVKKSGQKIYMVSSDQQNERDQYPDQRLGCIPMVKDWESNEDYPNPDQFEIFDHKKIGETCTAQTECASGCCGTGGTCQVHLPDSGVQCHQPPGQSCLTKEFCREETVQECKVYQVGFDAIGEPTCALRCTNVQMKGECLDHVCQPVQVPKPEPFDPNDPNFICADAPLFPSI